jgi:phosphopantothenoylcysteine decarboxylase/phosphopantothenate--cysteine ligase
MGFAIAESLAEAGAKDDLVAGPVSIEIQHPNIKRIDVMSGQEMYEKCIEIFPTTNGAIMSAAVADYTPVVVEDKKIKRKSSNLSIALKANPDIAASLGKLKNKNQVFVGFALETNNELENAQLKLKKKNFDFIVLNSLQEKGAGFKFDTNKITIVDRNNKIDKFELKSKKDVSLDIVNKILSL